MFDRKTCVGKDICIRADNQNLDKKNVNLDKFCNVNPLTSRFSYLSAVYSKYKLGIAPEDLFILFNSFIY